MSNLELAETRLTFDDLLEAVQDSKRGRWFLKEYESRIHQRDTQSMLTAISKLEKRMEHMAPQASSPDDLAKVRMAIANARDDLFKLGLGKDAMSTEGRLFAGLAEMARKAMPDSADQNAVIVRSLQLVDEIDRTIAPPSNDDKGAKFFVADSNLFDRPAIAKPVLVEVPQPVAAVMEEPKPVIAYTKPAAVKKDDAVSTGAKLVIRKVNSLAPMEATTPAPVVPDIVVEAPKTAEIAPMPTSELPKPTIEATDNPRIVIIRRKAEDMPEVSIGEVSAA